MKTATRSIAAVLALAAALSGCGEAKKEVPPQTVAPFVAGDAAKGKSVAEQHCQACHGIDGRGAAPGIPHLAAQSERYLMASMNEYKVSQRLHAALRDMTASLTDADLHNVSAYYASLPPVPVQARAQPLSPYERGKKLAEPCASCHNADGNSTTPGVPTLAGQQPHYFAAALDEYHAGDRQSDAAKSMLKVRGRVDIDSLALYYSSQAPVRRAMSVNGDLGAGEPLSGVCGGCHGARGISNDSATPNLAGQDAQYLVAAITAYGKSRKHEVMDGQVAKLSERDIRNIAAFYAAQAPRLPEKGHTLVQEIAAKCNRCHGPSSSDPTMMVPKISAQDKDYLVMALRAYRDDRRESSTMHRMSLPYSDAIIESLAGLYANEPPR